METITRLLEIFSINWNEKVEHFDHFWTDPIIFYHLDSDYFDYLDSTISYSWSLVSPIKKFSHVGRKNWWKMRRWYIIYSERNSSFGFTSHGSILESKFWSICLSFKAVFHVWLFISLCLFLPSTIVWIFGSFICQVVHMLLEFIGFGCQIGDLVMVSTKRWPLKTTDIGRLWNLNYGRTHD